MSDDAEKSVPSKTEFIPYSFLEKEACNARLGNQGKHHVCQEAEARARGKHAEGFYYVFGRRGKESQGQHLRTDNLLQGDLQWSRPRP